MGARQGINESQFAVVHLTRFHPVTRSEFGLTHLAGAFDETNTTLFLSGVAEGVESAELRAKLEEMVAGIGPVIDDCRSQVGREEGERGEE